MNKSTRQPFKAMFYYELYSMKHGICMLLLFILAPTIAIIVFKMFFQSALQFGYKSNYSDKLNQQYLDFSLMSSNNYTFINYVTDNQDNQQIMQQFTQLLYEDYQIMLTNHQIPKSKNISVDLIQQLIVRCENFSNIQSQISKQVVQEALQQFKNETLRVQISNTINQYLNNSTSLDKNQIQNLLIQYFLKYNINIDQQQDIQNIISQISNNYNNQSQTMQIRPSLFSINFTYFEKNETIKYFVMYNKTMYDELNKLQNETYWGLLTYYQRYQNMIGAKLQILLDNAILQYNNKKPLQYNFFPFPNKQLNINDPTILDHGIIGLSIIVLFICCVSYISRDRGKQQQALRLLSMDEASFQFLRFLFSTIIFTISAVLMVISGYFASVLPFSSIDLGTNLLVGIIIGAFITSFCQLISVLFGQNGPILPIVIILIITVMSNFILEIVIYILYAAQSLKDKTILPNIIYYVMSVILPNLNIMNIVDILRNNIQNVALDKKINITTAFNPNGLIMHIKQKQAKEFIFTSYQLDGIGQLLLYFIINTVICTLLSHIISYAKKERNFPGANIFQLRKAHQRILKRTHDNIECKLLQLSKIDIKYKRCCKKPVLAVENFDLDFEEISEKNKSKQVRLGLLGVSAAGKTSILSLISGQVRIKKNNEQSIAIVNNHNLFDKQELYLLRREISICPQANENVIQGLNIKENLQISLMIKGQYKKTLNRLERKKLIIKLLKEFQLDEHLNKTIDKLSGGMLRRLSICNCIISNYDVDNNERRDILILDEISSGLDPFTCRIINNEILKICQNDNINFILSTHDMKQVGQICNYIVMMKTGQTQMSGVIEDIKYDKENSFYLTMILLEKDEQNYKSVNQIFDILLQNQIEYKVIINTIKQIQIQVKDIQQTEMVRQLIIDKVAKLSIDKGNINDIFVEKIDNQEMNNAYDQNQELVQQSFSKYKKLKQLQGLFQLFYIEDYRNSFCKIPFAIFFLLFLPLITYISLFINNIMVNFMQSQMVVAKQMVQASLFKDCITCCNIPIERVPMNTQLMQNLSTCLQDASCFTDGINNIYSPGKCLQLMKYMNLPVLQPPIKQINQQLSRSYYYSGYQDNVDLIYTTHITKMSKPKKSNIKPNSNIIQYNYVCENCKAICQNYKNKTKTDCFKFINGQIGHSFQNVSFCFNICSNDFNYNISNEINQQISQLDFKNLLKDIPKKQSNRITLKNNIIIGDNTQQQIQQFNRMYLPTSMIQTNEQNNNVDIYSYFPSIRGTTLLFEEYKVKVMQYKSLNKSFNFSNQNISNNNFWDYKQQYTNKSIDLFNVKQIDTDVSSTSEMYNSINLGLQPQLFDQASIDINKLTNEQLQSKNKYNNNLQKLKSSDFHVSSVIAETQLYPYTNMQYNSTSFNQFLTIVQILIISICSSIPMLKSAVFFTQLKNTNFLSLLNIHTISNIKLYFSYILYSLMYIIPTILLVCLVSQLIKIEQFMFNQVLFFFYLLNTSFSSVIMGIIIAQVCSDKRQAVFLSSIFLIVIMFVTLFLIKSNFLLIIIPQLYSMHQLLYLTQLNPQYEYYGLAITFFVSILYCCLCIVDKGNVFENTPLINDINYLFNNNYDKQQILIGHKKQQQKQHKLNELDETYDLVINNLNIQLQNKIILDNINIKINHNSVFGLLGLSGSGKSITIKTMLNQIKSYTGNIYIKNKQNQLVNIKNQKQNMISYVPQQDILLDKMTINNHIKIFCNLHTHMGYKYAFYLVNVLNLNEHLNKKIINLSGGTKRRLSFLLALLQQESDVVAFDECSTGLSPDLKIMIYNVICLINQKLGKTCIITTHYMDEIQALTNGLIVLNNGKVEICINTNLLIKQQSSKDSVILKYIDNQNEQTVILRDSRHLASEVEKLSNQNIENYYLENNDLSTVFLQLYDNFTINKQYSIIE